MTSSPKTDDLFGPHFALNNPVACLASERQCTSHQIGCDRLLRKPSMIHFFPVSASICGCSLNDRNQFCRIQWNRHQNRWRCFFFFYFSFLLSVWQHFEAPTPKVALRDQTGNEELDQNLAFNNLASAADGSGCDRDATSWLSTFQPLDKNDSIISNHEKNIGLFVQTFPSRGTVHCRLPCAGQNRHQSPKTSPYRMKSRKSGRLAIADKNRSDGSWSNRPNLIRRVKETGMGNGSIAALSIAIGIYQWFFDLSLSNPSDNVQVGRVNRRSGIKR